MPFFIQAILAISSFEVSEVISSPPDFKIKESNNKKLIFDIGANDSYSCLGIALCDNDSVIYAFEPNPSMIKLMEKVPKLVNNYKIVPKAVSDFNGQSKFHIVDDKFRGKCSSLLEFNDNIEKTWPGRNDLYFTNDIIVDVVRLDSFIEENKIETIDYFHCDTQGNDLKVLKGLGKYIKIIKKGVVEAAENKDVALYKGQDTKEEMIKFLEQNNFKIKCIELNDIFGNEVNIYFENENSNDWNTVKETVSIY